MEKICLINRLQDSIKFEESIIKLRTNLSFIRNNKKTILITSTSKKEGKSQISLALSISMSQINKKVLLLDANVRNSNINIYSKNNVEIHSLCDYLNGNVEVSKIINETNFDNLDFIYAGMGNINLLDNELFFNLISYAKERYDYIFIDCASCSYPEPFMLSRYCDGILFVIRKNYLNIDRILNSKNELNKTRTKIIGTVFNTF